MQEKFWHVRVLHACRSAETVIQSLDLGCRHYLIFLGSISKGSNDGH